MGCTVKYGASHNIAAIVVRLNSTGFNAGNANWRKLLSTAPASDVIEMNRRNGNKIRNMVVVIAYFYGSYRVPGAIKVTTHGASRKAERRRGEIGGGRWWTGRWLVA